MCQTSYRYIFFHTFLIQDLINDANNFAILIENLSYILKRKYEE